MLAKAYWGPSMLTGHVGRVQRNSATLDISPEATRRWNCFYVFVYDVNEIEFVPLRERCGCFSYLTVQKGPKKFHSEVRFISACLKHG